MKKFLFVAFLAILSVSGFSQATSGRVLVRDTSKYHPPAIAYQLVIDSASKTLLVWRGPLNKYFQVSLSSSAVSGAFKGTATLVSGTVTVSTAAALTTSTILVSLNTPGGTLGADYKVATASIVNGTSFVIAAINSAGATVTTDTSTINWVIIN